MPPAEVRFDPDLSGVLVVVAVAVFGGLGRSIQVGFGARERLGDKFSARIARSRAKLEADSLLPDLAAFVDQVRGEMDRSGALAVQPGPEAVDFIQDSLQNVGYLDQLSRLSQTASDRHDFDRLFQEAVRWANVKAISLCGALPGLLYFAVILSLEGESLAEALNWLAGLVSSVGLTLGFTSWILETLSRNRLSDLCRKYE